MCRICFENGFVNIQKKPFLLIKSILNLFTILIKLHDRLWIYPVKTLLFIFLIKYLKNYELLNEYVTYTDFWDYY